MMLMETALVLSVVPSSTVPERAGVASAVVRVLTDTVGEVASIAAPLLNVSIVILPAASVALATILKRPSGKSAGGTALQEPPTTVAPKVWASTVVLIDVMVLSMTVPVNVGRRLLLDTVSMVTIGATVSTVSPLDTVMESVLPAASATSNWTLYVPSLMGVRELPLTLQLPLPKLPPSVCPATVTEMVPLSFMVPERFGVLSLVVKGVMEAEGGVKSTVTSRVVPSVPTLPAVSVAVTATSN